MPQLTIRYSAELEALMQGRAKERVQAAMTRSFTKIGARLEAEVKARTPVRSGALRRSIGFQVAEDGMSLTIGSFAPTGGEPLIYAAQVHWGGPIEPIPPKQFLAIPLSYFRGNTVMTRSGVGGISAGVVRDNPQQFGFTGTFVAKGIVFGKLPGGRTKRLLGGRWDIVPLFKLVSSVNQKGNPFISSVVEEREGDIIAQLQTDLRLELGGT